MPLRSLVLAHVLVLSSVAGAMGTLEGLKPGDPAPRFQVERFLKGEPIAEFKKGQVYVLDFWSTWCGPCLVSMPHLSELQREYRDKGVTICGINVWENPNYTDETRASVVKFLRTKAALVDFAIAYDGAAKGMDKAWMQASGRNGIPCSFVVDQRGVLAWVGHPDMLGMVLEEVTRGTWDIVSGPDRLKAATAQFKQAAGEYRTSLAAGDAAWEAAVRRHPAMKDVAESQRLGALFGSGHVREACEMGNRIVADAARARNPGPIYAVLENLSDPKVLKTTPGGTLLLNAARANFDLADPAEYGPHVGLARALFFARRTDEARSEAKKALALVPAGSKASLEKWLKEMEQDAQPDQ